jgi:hypothetical protein
MKTPTDPRAILHSPILGGSQTIFRFENNFGASVVCYRGSYGYPELFELAVTKYEPGESNPDNFTLDMSTPITSDVLGFLNDEDVTRILDEIEKLNE